MTIIDNRFNFNFNPFMDNFKNKFICIIKQIITKTSKILLFVLFRFINFQCDPIMSKKRNIDYA